MYIKRGYQIISSIYYSSLLLLQPTHCCLDLVSGINYYVSSKT